MDSDFKFSNNGATWLTLSEDAEYVKISKYGTEQFIYYYQYMPTLGAYDATGSTYKWVIKEMIEQ